MSSLEFLAMTLAGLWSGIPLRSSEMAKVAFSTALAGPDTTICVVQDAAGTISLGTGPRTITLETTYGRYEPLDLKLRVPGDKAFR